MHFATTVALLASAASAVSAVRPMMPYKPAARRMAFMPLPGQSLARRDNYGYEPEETKCNNPNAATCEGACGQGYTQCAATDKAIHCFNPAAGQDETFCCPEGMDTEACAAAYTVTGGLVIASETSSSTSTSSTSTSSSTSSTPEPKTTEKPTPTPVHTTVTKAKTTSICTTPTPVYSHHNSTIHYTPTKKPTYTVIPVPTVIPKPSSTSAPGTPSTVPSEGRASTLAGSGLLLVAAGFIALL
ncbi:hypothetical protein NLU13_0467 [Sarocladium strictum]|uniref:Uncharacterized protein n=1 Tax=Sarocladium strictum TaxID=5046 RepID=A0AA39LBG5_SARSR|nr:hypothetical protein NLU13_0467 [Sarocladium strictum]